MGIRSCVVGAAEIERVAGAVALLMGSRIEDGEGGEARQRRRLRRSLEATRERQGRPLDGWREGEASRGFAPANFFVPSLGSLSPWIFLGNLVTYKTQSNMNGEVVLGGA